MLKLGYVSIFHRFSLKHLDWYVKEYAGSHNLWVLDTIEQLLQLVMEFSSV